MSDPAIPAAVAQPSGRLAHTLQEFAAQYAAAILAALIAATLFFPGNRFLPVPWQFDDYNNLAGHLKYQNDLRAALLCARPVSTNVIFCLGAAGETAFYVVMFLLTALLPVLAVRLALRLFRCHLGDCPNFRFSENGTVPFSRKTAPCPGDCPNLHLSENGTVPFKPGPCPAIWLCAAVSFFTFLCDESPWFYRYTGMMTNLTSVATGLLSAYAYSRSLDGRKSAFIAASLLFLASAFAKEDMLLFVPLFVSADWCILRINDKRRASLRWLALAYVSFAVVAAMLFSWNAWIVDSPFTSGTAGPYKQDWTLSHVVGQAWNYAHAWRASRIALLALAAAAGLSLLRPGHRIAALSSVLLAVSLVLPYTVVQRYSGYYCLNWLSVSLALALVGFAAASRPLAPRRLSILIWIVPFALIVAAMLWRHSNAECRTELTTTLNQLQENSRYAIQQLLRRQAEFPQADTVALQGIDDVYSPWYKSTGLYVNAKLGRQIHWLLVARPDSLVAKTMTGKLSNIGFVQVISEQDLAAYPGITTLKFDKNQNLTIHSAINH